MFILFGSKLYGKVDVTQEGTFIKTKFFHIFFIPIIPLESYIFTKDQPKEGFPIKMRGKSVLFAYIRAFCYLGLFGVFSVFVNSSNSGNFEFNAILFFIQFSVGALSIYGLIWTNNNNNA